mmetsp:Transcript_141105/g.450697  ORF Transcript_141105/g.450697 Transcript_141105/m.450697 type:complete len:252 (+) Transcript_141105:281-1036(+)
MSSGPSRSCDLAQLANFRHLSSISPSSAVRVMAWLRTLVTLRRATSSAALRAATAALSGIKRRSALGPSTSYSVTGPASSAVGEDEPHPLSGASGVSTPRAAADPEETEDELRRSNAARGARLRAAGDGCGRGSASSNAASPSGPCTIEELANGFSAPRPLSASMTSEPESNGHHRLPICFSTACASCASDRPAVDTAASDEAVRLMTVSTTASSRGGSCGRHSGVEGAMSRDGCRWFATFVRAAAQRLEH